MYRRFQISRVRYLSLDASGLRSLLVGSGSVVSLVSENNGARVGGTDSHSRKLAV